MTRDGAAADMHHLHPLPVHAAADSAFPLLLLLLHHAGMCRAERGHCAAAAEVVDEFAAADYEADVAACAQPGGLSPQKPYPSICIQKKSD